MLAPSWAQLEVTCYISPLLVYKGLPWNRPNSAAPSCLDLPFGRRSNFRFTWYVMCAKQKEHVCDFLPAFLTLCSNPHVKRWEILATTKNQKVPQNFRPRSKHPNTKSPSLKGLQTYVFMSLKEENWAFSCPLALQEGFFGQKIESSES